MGCTLMYTTLAHTVSHGYRNLYNGGSLYLFQHTPEPMVSVLIKWV